MRKIFLALLTITVLFVSSGYAQTDEKSRSVISGINAKLKEFGNYEVKFTISAYGMDNVKGQYVVSGDKYRIVVGDQEHFSDGSNRYELYLSEKEIVIDKVDVKSKNVLSNPTKAFEFAEDEFQIEWDGEHSFAGVDYYVIKLTPLHKSLGSFDIKLFVNPETMLPANISYLFDGQSVDIYIEEMVKVDSVESSLFTIDLSSYEGWEVVDFR